MNMRKWTVWLTAGLLIVLAVTGYFAIAAEVGSKQDPLVTVSYLDVIAGETMAKIDAQFAEKKTQLDQEIDARLASLTGDIDKRVAEYKASLGAEKVSDAVIDSIAEAVLAQMKAEGIGQTPETPPATGEQGQATWKVVTLEAGKTLVGQVGCEIILRLGSATCVASGSPGLINLSDGTDLPNGGALKTNNLYIVTINGRGITSSEKFTALVSGSYSIR